MQKPIKIIHTADIHFSRENQEKALHSLVMLADFIHKEKIDLIIIAGDLFDRPVNNTESSGFPDLISIIQHIMMSVPIGAIIGTPTHDIPGCYEVFEKIEAKYNFKILQSNHQYFPDLLITGLGRR